jgi:hypothetical protein
LPTTYKVLGQSAPSATTDTTLYTVPAATQTVVSTIVVSNRSATAGSYRIAVRPAGAGISNQHYLAYDVAVGGGDSTTLTLGITLGATDVITVRASTADMSFSAFGSEIS